MEDKTIEYKGKSYEKDKYYLFGDHGDEVFKCMKLKTINTEDEEYPFIGSTSVEYRFLKQLPSSDNLGTITDAPVDLEDGAAYTFDILNTPTQIGLYREFTNNLWNSTVDISVNQCTNIRKMEVVKDEH